MMSRSIPIFNAGHGGGASQGRNASGNFSHSSASNARTRRWRPSAGIGGLGAVGVASGLAAMGAGEVENFSRKIGRPGEVITVYAASSVCLACFSGGVVWN
jgi:hypothetical protein